ncbi:hypothetical protein GCM10027446_20710 [Angustibacter peucedani]
MPGTSAADLLAAVVASTPYAVLATADADGTPWATPVWCASDDWDDVYWVSAPTTRHSRNLAVRPQLALTVFDSTQPAGTGTGAYLSATAAQVPEAELDEGLAVFNRAAARSGLAAWSREQVTAPAKHRLYRARVLEVFVNDEHDERVPVRRAT